MSLSVDQNGELRDVDESASRMPRTTAAKYTNTAVRTIKSQLTRGTVAIGAAEDLPPLYDRGAIQSARRHNQKLGDGTASKSSLVSSVAVSASMQKREQLARECSVLGGAADPLPFVRPPACFKTAK
jgi:hypothetical protein